MKVLLKKDVDSLGYAGEVFEVANGYGRNYLIPRGLAVKASPSVLKEAAVWRERAEARRVQIRAEHEALAEKIAEVRLVFSRLAGETGKLYGSVTTNDIVDQLNETLGTEIDRRAVVGDPLRQLGEHQVTIRLSRDVQPQIFVDIHPEEPEEPTPEEVAALAAAQLEAEEVVEEAEDDLAVDETPLGGTEFDDDDDDYFDDDDY